MHVLGFAARRTERQTDIPARIYPMMLQGRLDRDRVDLAEDRVDQRFECDLRSRPASADVAFEIIVDHADCSAAGMRLETVEMQPRAARATGWARSGRRCRSKC